MHGVSFPQAMRFMSERYFANEVSVYSIYITGRDLKDVNYEIRGRKKAIVPSYMPSISFKACLTVHAVLGAPLNAT